MNNFDEYAPPLISPRSVKRDSDFLGIGSPRISHEANFGGNQSSDGFDSPNSNNKRGSSKYEISSGRQKKDAINTSNNL